MTDKTSLIPEERTPLERLVEIADTLWERAIRLEETKVPKRDDHMYTLLQELRVETFDATMRLWRTILSMLPQSGLDQPRRKELEIDAHKIISRSAHKLGDHEAARRHITRAIDLGYTDGFISLGAICLDEKDWVGAETAFRSALAKDVQVTRAHAGLGEMYFAQGMLKLREDPQHKELFHQAEAEFVAAGKERFAEGYERAMELFETIGWRDKAAALGQKAAQLYGVNRVKYGERLRALDKRLRVLAGEERHDKIVAGVSRKLGTLIGGKDRT